MKLYYTKGAIPMKKQSRKVWKILLLTMLVAASMVITASAAKVSKVTYKRSYTGGKESVTVWGKTSSGKIVWTYRSASYTAAQCNAVTVKTKGSYVYVLEGRKYVRLGRQSGRVLAKKNVLPSGWSWGSPAVVISSNGNLYAMGYLDNTVYRISKSGTVAWKRKIKDSYFWPAKMKLTSSSLTIYFEAPTGNCRAVLSPATGKVKKYAKGW